MMKDNALFYTCSLIEYMGRKNHQKRSYIVNRLGEEYVKSIYKYADVLHCEPIEKIADEYKELAGLEEGDFDNVAACRYLVPGYWDIGDVYTRLITDVNSGDIVKTIIEVYNSTTSTHIDDYNSAIYFQPRDYIKLYYLETH